MEETLTLYLKGLNIMKLTKNLSFKQKVKYTAVKALMIAFTGRIDLRRDDDVMDGDS
jgi:hypothetical protein